MVKRMIVSDIDGTLLQGGRQNLTEESLKMVRRIVDRGFYFAACSGRDYSSLRPLFPDLVDDIYFISTNGGQIIYRDEVLYEQTMDRGFALDLAEDISQHAPVDVLLTGGTKSYYIPPAPGLVSFMEYSRTVVEPVARFSDIEEEIIKIATFCEKGSDRYFTDFLSRWNDKIHVAKAGPHWIDFMSANKKDGLAALAAQLSVGQEQVYAFGDQYNDVGMLNWAGKGYIMAHTDQALHRPEFILCPDILQAMQDLLDQYSPVA